MAVQCVLVGKGKDDVFTAVYGETTFDKVLKAYNENKVVQVIYQNRIYYLDNTTVVDSPEAFSFISAFSNQNDETGEIKHYVISLMTGDSWSGPFLQNSTPATHANTHSKNGDDPLSPADIGAMELSENILKQSNEDITSQVAQALSKNLVPFSGGTMTGLLNVLTPVGDSNATTKKYVDDALSEKIGMDGIGDLHVWKKTARDASVSAPGYNLGDIKPLTNICQAPSGYQGYFGVKVEYSDEVTVNNLGVISLVSPSEIELGFTGKTAVFLPEGADNTLKNKFLKIVSVLAEQPNAQILDSYKDAVIHCESNFYCNGYGSSSPGYNIYFKNFRLVTPYPAGFAHTYPVSTNPNAYQEGDDAKAAGYTLGEVENNVQILSGGDNWPTTLYYADSVDVDNEGQLSLQSPNQYTFTTSSQYQNVSTLAVGRFIKIVPEASSGFSFRDGIWFVPSDATVTVSNYKISASKIQKVTGYAAIPAGTTIEYLGKLGDKARVQVVSYMGTGTYGESNPNSLTFDFVPKCVIISSAPVQNSYVYIAIMVPDAGIYSVVMSSYLGYESRTPGGSGIVTKNNKTITFYSGDNTAQLNGSGIKYTAVAIG